MLVMYCSSLASKSSLSRHLYVSSIPFLCCRESSSEDMCEDTAKVDNAGVPLPSEVKSEPSSWDSPFEEVLLSEESSPGGEEYPGGALKNLMVSLEAPGFLIFLDMVFGGFGCMANIVPMICAQAWDSLK